MDLPIIGALKRRSERETAQLEDDVVDALFSVTNEIALHGGTAVWRCYGGKRFSKDIDIYLWAKNFKSAFIESMQKLGIEVAKYREKGITFIHVRKGSTEIKIEPRNLEKASILAPYERVDGGRMNILALSPEDIVLEKIDAYLDRGAYKDLYDITVLLNSIKDQNKIKKALYQFATTLKKPDESFQTYNEFRTLIYTGTVPSFENMSDMIKRWVS
jgi:predicted nucleotidyltransferase component of viral defense system